ncbi:MAG: proline iminopeptidase-family hydrolase [Gordonia sp. (in: high G+C Gram-positive bacteria)]
MADISEGVVPFSGGHTWYRVTTPEVAVAGAVPLVVLHGGPGMAHNYVRSIAQLADETGRTVIHYDQFGCGRSTHRPEAPAQFWRPELYIEEFATLIDYFALEHYHLLGQSWGGMLGAEIAVLAPEGLASLSICNSPASMELWINGAAQLRAELPEEHRRALDVHEAAGTLDHPEYLAATAEFYRRHVCRVEPMPTDFTESEQQMEAEPTVYHTMNGPNEFHVIGSMRTWNIIDRLPQINVPTLVIAGEYDEATPATWAPFVERIPGAISHVFPGGSHCTHLEQPEEFRRVVGEFLLRNDSRTSPTVSASHAVTD